MTAQEPISILYFCNETDRGGAEEHMLALLRGLDRKFFQPYLAGTPELLEKLGQDIPRDVRLFPMTLRKPVHLAGAIKLARVFRKQRIGILHSHLFYASLFASPVGRLCGVPLIFETPHVREQWRKGLKSSYGIDRFVGGCVDYYIAVSDANAKYLLEEKQLPSGKIVVIHNGCDVDHFDPNHQVPKGLREQLGFGPNDPVLTVLGRLEPQKGHHVLLMALPLIRRKIPNVRVVCVGDGSLRQTLAEQTAALGIEKSVKFVGFQSNVKDWLALATATVLPSFYEGLPLAAIESLAAGKPVLASAVDGTPEVVQNGICGLLFQPGNYEELAAAACGLLAQPELARSMGDAGRRWVCEQFSLKRQIKKTQALYLESWEKRLIVREGKPANPEKAHRYTKPLSSLPETSDRSLGREGRA